MLPFNTQVSSRFCIANNSKFNVTFGCRKLNPTCNEQLSEKDMTEILSEECPIKWYTIEKSPCKSIFLDKKFAWCEYRNSLSGHNKKATRLVCNKLLY